MRGTYHHLFNFSLPRFLIVYLTTDINPRACICTSLTGQQNAVALDAVTGSLAAPFRPRLHGQVDVLLFNPPYVPTADAEAAAAQAAGDIGGSWAGGAKGMQVTSGLLNQVEVRWGDLFFSLEIFDLLLMRALSAIAFSWRKVLPRCLETERYIANKKLAGGVARVEERGQFSLVVPRNVAEPQICSDRHRKEGTPGVFICSSIHAIHIYLFLILFRSVRSNDNKFINAFAGKKYQG